jgi:DNA invertase Pin-like site-specific DNA recombinase
VYHADTQSTLHNSVSWQVRIPPHVPEPRSSTGQPRSSIEPHEWPGKADAFQMHLIASQQLQLDALAAAGCGKVFKDRASGARADRPGLQKALDCVREGDVLIVWKLDRLGRSLPRLIETVSALEKRGVGFRSLTEEIDRTTPGGRLVFHLFGALGQFERDLIRERTRA